MMRLRLLVQPRCALMPGPQMKSCAVTAHGKGDLVWPAQDNMRQSAVDKLAARREHDTDSSRRAVQEDGLEFTWSLRRIPGMRT